MNGEKIEQAAWVKPGVRVRWKGSPFGIGGVVIPIPAGPFVDVGVLYDGSAVVWEGDVASSWEPAAGAELTPSVMLDGGPCAKPEAADGLDQLDRRLSEALWLHRDNPTSAATFDALRRLWDLLTAQFGGAWSRASGDVCGDHAGRVRSEACYVCKAGPMQACGSTAAPSPSPASFKIKPGASWGDLLKAHPPTTPVQVAVGTTVIDLNHIHAHGEQASRPVSTMDRVIARLDAIDAALKPLAHLALDAEGRVIAVPPISSTTTPPATKLADDGTSLAATQGHCESAQPTDHARLPTTPASPNVPAHEERYRAAREAVYYDTYGAPCPRCGAPRWGGCVAVDGEPTDAAPDQAVLVRVEHKTGDHVFQHISWSSDQIELVARGIYEACSALGAEAASAQQRPGLQRVARRWESLTKAEQDYWFNVVRGYLDGSSDPGLSPVEDALLGAMARVFRLERAGRS